MIFGFILATSAVAIPTPTVEIFPGVNMPLVGAGTWQYNNSQAYNSVCNAFDAGYTYVDTAWGYGNQQGVGQALQDCWFAKGRTREDLFIMTKIPGGLDADEVRLYHSQNLAWLGIGHVDSLLTHFPCDWNETPERCNPKRRQEQWLAMEGLYNAGLTKSIGVSHYCKQHIDDVLAVATVMPSINQVEWHVGSQDVDNVIEYSRSKGIFFQSYSPLCGPCTYEPQDSLITGDLVTGIAANYPGVSGSQVSLKYLVQYAETQSHYAGVIPKSDNPAHLASNLDLFHFTLSDKDMASLAAATKPPGEPGDCDAP
jgi:diketogulonate reductase-like aldo/keto reductase